MDIKKVGNILKSLNGVEYVYMKYCMDIRDEIDRTMKAVGISKEDFCKHFGVPEKKYDDFILGNYNYSLVDIAKLKAFVHENELKP